MSDTLILLLCAIMSSLAWYFGAMSGFRTGFRIGFNIALNARIEAIENKEKADAPIVE